MPSLQNILSGQDLGFLKMVANSWGLELNAPDAHTARTLLIESMNEENLVREIIDTLPEEAKMAIHAIFEAEGVFPWPKFTRDYGEVRVMGAAKRDREHPDINPANPAEMLWYRALIGRAFLNFDGEPQEYAFMPEEILIHMEPSNEKNQHKPGRPASPGEIQKTFPVNQIILDDACTLLSALRMEFPEEKLVSIQWTIPYTFLKSLLSVSNLLTSAGTPEPQNTREFLENSSAKSLSFLVQNWLQSSILDEMYWLPGLEIEGVLDHNPVKTRQFIFKQISTIPHGQWWNIDSFINDIHQRNPDFQRPAGNYDSWFIRDKITGDYLRGFTNWTKVDGELIRFLIQGPFYWLGLVELAASEKSDRKLAFKFSDQAYDLWEGKEPQGISIQEEKINLDSNGKLIIHRSSPRAIRYQIARFCDWDGFKENEYYFHISPGSLIQAQKQGLNVKHFITLLQRNLEHPLPLQIRTALENWQANGTEILLKKELILQVTNPKTLIALQNHRASRFIISIITPEVAIIQSGSEEIIKNAFLELGFLSDINIF